MKRALSSSLLGGALVLGMVSATAPAAACGGFFCSQSQPVNQAAERIIFADNGDGTVTAVIQILYEGPSEKFSWLLPISSVPMGDEIAVASNLAFQRLQGATNPNYSLTVRVEGTCRSEGDFNTADGSQSAGGSASSGPRNAEGGNVTVEATGIVGAFEWTVISIDPALSKPVDAAVEWLGANGYDVPEGAPALIGPYLDDGMYLLALRLTKGSDVGSIRPLVLTYEGSKPSIPIKLTAVAANADMGVMTWVLGDAQAVPQNYLGLELNEARINWFNASSNYNSVVTAAADEAGGQGFVTEFAGSSSTLAQAVFTQFDESQWASFKSSVFPGFQQMFDSAFNTYGQWDGFWDAVSAAVTLPATVKLADFKLCPNCYSSQVQFSPSVFVEALETGVIEPVRLVQSLINAHPMVTRLYTTLSADEMTLDPLFTFNPDLPDVSNQHTAERVIECNSNVGQFEAPWRIELPQGDIIRGGPQQVGMWPAELDSQPANRRILRQSEAGEGRLIENNAEPIDKQVTTYNDSLDLAAANARGGGCSTSGFGANAGTWSLLGLCAVLFGRARRRKS